MTVTWILEEDVTLELHKRILRSATTLGHVVLERNDTWIRKWPALDDPVVFHGSLELAAAAARVSPWSPGAFCDPETFRYSHYSMRMPRHHLLNRDCAYVPLNALVENPDETFARFGNPEALFFRPDSHLKPFSGRVVKRADISYEAFDFGYYYEDATLCVVAAPVQDVNREWRYVVVDDLVVAGSEYGSGSESRGEAVDHPDSAPWRIAQAIARSIEAPEAVYVLDIARVGCVLSLLELGPFSGADLYACDTDAIVAAVETHLAGVTQSVE